MPPDYNKTILAGRLTRDPETKTTQGGTSVCSFGMATSRRHKDREPETLFIDCTAFGQTGDTIARFCSKGSPVLIEGHLRLEQWADKVGGRRSKISLVVDHIQFLGRNGDEERQEKPQHQEKRSPAATMPDESDIPF